jgi:hypothetical protein
MIIKPPKKKRKKRKNRVRPLSLAEQQSRRLDGKSEDIKFKGRKLRFSYYTENDSFDYKSGTYEVDSVFGISGLYFLLNNRLNVVYIGESKDCVARIKQHFDDDNKKFKFFKIYRFDGSDKQRKAIEAKLIKRYNPILNKQHNRYSYK